MKSLQNEISAKKEKLHSAEVRGDVLEGDKASLYQEGKFTG